MLCAKRGIASTGEILRELKSNAMTSVHTVQYCQLIVYVRDPILGKILSSLLMC